MLLDPYQFISGKERVHKEFRLSDCYCFAYKTLLMQGWSQTPGSYQNRIVFVFVMIAGMLLYWHWEAMVISYLAVRKIVLPYTSFEQLLSSSSDKVRCIVFFTCFYRWRSTSPLQYNRGFIKIH